MKPLAKGIYEILTALERGPKRFNELAITKVNTKPMNRRTFADRLKMLEDENLVERTVKSTRPPTVEYSITEKGQKLLALMRD
jgi:DNA-binding HxlR family transcriptional regulator